MQDYVVIDLEMTGLNAKTDHILEVGAVRVRNHQAVDKFGAILCQNVKIPEKVTELTGITEAMVQGGMEKEEAMRQFFEFMEACDKAGVSVVCINEDGDAGKQYECVKRFVKEYFGREKVL